MKIKLFKGAEIRIEYITRRSKVKQTLQEHGKIRAVKVCRELFGYDLKKALDYVRSLDKEG